MRTKSIESVEAVEITWYVDLKHSTQATHNQHSSDSAAATLDYTDTITGIAVTDAPTYGKRLALAAPPLFSDHMSSCPLSLTLTTSTSPSLSWCHRRDNTSSAIHSARKFT